MLLKDAFVSLFAKIDSIHIFTKNYYLRIERKITIIILVLSQSLYPICENDG